MPRRAAADMTGELLRRGKFPRPVDGEAVACDWRARGFGCEAFTDPPGREWVGFVHAANELLTVVEGRLRVDVGGASFVVGPGDEVLIPKGAVHSVVNMHAAATRWLYGYDG
jgi:mannose-6-phosphate isomerase-like protein (cupin superfamily)